MGEFDKDGLINCDFDGVLNTGSTDLYIDNILGALRHCDIQISESLTRSKVVQMWGTSPRKILSIIIAQETGSDKIETIQSAANQYFHHAMMTDFVDNIQPVPGASEALETLHERFTLALNTSADREVLFEAVMPKLGINPKIFDAKLIWTADNVPEHLAKPDPYAIKQALRITGYAKVQTVMVGDSPADVLSAHYADVEPVVVLTGNLTPELAKDVGAEHVIEDITHLVSKMDELIPRRIGRSGIKAYQLNGNIR